MKLFSNEIRPEQAKEYGLSDHALTNSVDLRNPILHEMFLQNSRKTDLEAGSVRGSMFLK